MDEVEVPGHPGESSLLVPEAGRGARAAEDAREHAQPVARRRHLDDDAPVRLDGLRHVRGEPPAIVPMPPTASPWWAASSTRTPLGACTI